MAKEFYNHIFELKKEEKRLEEVKQFCYDNIILSGCRPKTVDGTIFYLRHYGEVSHITQEVLCEKYDISTVALRNNVKKIRNSKHYEKIKKMLGNPNIDKRI